MNLQGVVRSLEANLNLGSRAAEAGESGTFALRAGPLASHELTVLSFKGTEGISQLFSFQVVCWSDLDAPVITPMLLGQPATFSMQVRGGAPRIVHGIVASVEAQGMARADHRRQYRIRVVPRMWLLKHRTNSRIFQNMTPAEIVSAVLGEAGVAYRWSLTQKYPVRNYCVQYRETDYHFVKRILAEEGIFFHFEPPAALLEAVDEIGAAAFGAIGAGAAGIADVMSLKETVVMSDTVAGYPTIQGTEDSAVGAVVDAVAGALASREGSGIFSTIRELAGAPGAPVVLFRSQEGMNGAAESVYALTTRERVTSRSNHLRDYDFRRPMLALDARATAPRSSTLTVDALTSPGSLRTAVLGAAAEVVGSALGEVTPLDLEVYAHHGQYEEPEVKRTVAQRHLEQLRARAGLARGKSNCRRLFAGARFQLEGHVELDREYVVTKVSHEGIIPEYQGEKDRGALKTYKNDFECVRANVAYRPAPAKSDLQQVLESAVVVGPDKEEIHTDGYGRVKVQFHWDRDGQRNENSSCWIRVAQTWAGASWGTQFIPRVGMEVLVSFIGGDEDRPVVVGCVYNGTHPTPHLLPERKTRSGIRTQSTRGGGGYNEIMFEDEAGSEEVYLRAQKDMRELVLHNRGADIRNNDETVVGNDQTVRVERDQRTIVHGARSIEVTSDQTSDVHGNRRDTVAGIADFVCLQDRLAAVGGNQICVTKGNSREEIRGDLTRKIAGDSMTLVVGKTPRASLHHVKGTARFTSTESTEITSEKEIVLRCGKSVLRILPDAIELVAPEVRVRAPGSGITFTENKMEIRAKEGAAFKAKELTLQSAAAEVKLDQQQASLQAPQISMGNQPSQLTAATDKQEKATNIELSDAQGRPIPNQHYVVQSAKGTRVGGMVGSDGKDEIYLQEGERVVFPELSDTHTA